MSILDALGSWYGTDKLAHGYLPHYHKHFASLPKRFSLLEIGVLGGASLRMWSDYFPEAQVWGVDISFGTFVEDESSNRFEKFLGDAGDSQFWADFAVPADLMVVVDDGSHHSGDIITAFDALAGHLLPGGWYVIEDLATQYEPEHEGGKDGSGTTNRIGHAVIDDVLRASGTWTEVHIYQEIAFLRKA